MKGIQLFAGFIFLVAALIFWGTFRDTPSQNYSPKEVASGEEVERKEVPGNPVRLIIPRLGVDAAVEQVGLDSRGRMDVPKDVYNVGWYNQGFKPGERGSAVMAGHLDTSTGAPAVFFNLRSLSSGDEILVTDTQGKEYSFVVTKREIYAFDQVPLEEVFNTTGKPGLNLITCMGTWDQTDRNYSQREVVYSELVP